MATEADFVSAIGTLCGGRVFADYAEGGPTTPFVTYQQVGGHAINFLEGGSTNRRHARMQINVWADTRLAANALAKQIEDTLKSSPFFANAVGALMARADPLTSKYRGAQQDFTVMLDDS